jgi:hypothetical protein
MIHRNERDFIMRLNRLDAAILELGEEIGRSILITNKLNEMLDCVSLIIAGLPSISARYGYFILAASIVLITLLVGA